MHTHMRVYDYYIIISESKDKCMQQLVERRRKHDTHTDTHTHEYTTLERTYSSTKYEKRYDIRDTDTIAGTKRAASRQAQRKLRELKSTVHTHTHKE